MILSVPSYVIPGTYLENLRFLDKHHDVRNVELLFFSWDRETETLLQSELAGIRSFRDRFSFTVHMPSLLRPDTHRLLESCEDFVTHFIVHPPLPGQPLPSYIRLLNAWRSRFGERFLLENTKLADLKPVREELPELPLCMDTGHLLLENREPAAFAKGNAALIRQIHLHGLANGRDHGSFLPTDPWFEELSPFLRAFTGIVELEIFDWTSLALLIPILRETISFS